jgi:arylsulfatase A-like enzyme
MEPHASYFAPPELIRKFGHVSIDDREAYRAHWEAYKIIWFADSRARRPVGQTDTTPDLDKAIANLGALRSQVNTLYDASVAFADLELGQTIAALKETGEWDRAIFILLADHGEELQDHGLWFHDQSLYEELTHVPLLVHFPGGAHGGQRVSQRVSLLDIKPTVLDFVGSPELCKDCRGSSLLPLLEPERGGAYTPVEAPSVRYNAWGYYRPLKATRGNLNVVVRDGNLKGIWNKEPGNVEVYDLAADPGEQNNLAASAPERAAAFEARAASFLDACRAARVPPVLLPPDAVKAADREQLEAHGYFGR